MSKHKPNTLVWVNPKSLDHWRRGVNTVLPAFYAFKTDHATKQVKVIIRPVSETPSVGKPPTPGKG